MVPHRANLSVCSVGPMRVTIYGGHGKIALLLAPMLVEAGHEVTSVVRNPDHVADVEATGATALVSSVEDADAQALVAQLTGQDAVVWSAGAGGGNPDRTYAVDRDAAIRSMDAAAAAGASRYVMVSFSGSDPDVLVPEDNPFRHYQDAKIAADDHLRGTDLDWTVLGPGTLYRLMREMRQDGLIAREARGAHCSDERQAHHVLTPLGRAVLKAEAARLRRTLDLASARPGGR